MTALLEAAPRTAAELGTIYLLHFSRPFKHAKHYLGWAASLDRRLAHHGTAGGANLMIHVRRAGITWELARTWEGTRAREAQLKRQGGKSRMCPLCGVKPVKPRTRRSVR
jgi:hypothetical protein